MEIERNKNLDPISFGPSEISPDQSIHGVPPSDIRSDLENDTDNQCHSANCVRRPKKKSPPRGKVFCYICGYPCFQNGGTIYDTFSVQCEHVLPVAALSLLSGLADGTSTKDKKFSDIVKKVKKNISIKQDVSDEYDMWAGRIIGAPPHSTSPPTSDITPEGGGVRGAAYHWAHPICNMIKSNWPFIILCYTKYGVFFVSDNLKILIPPDKEIPTGDEARHILGQVPNQQGFQKFTNINEYYDAAISTQNLKWLLNTTLGFTGMYKSWAELWKNALLLKKGTKGIDWTNDGYKQLLPNGGFEKDDPIFSGAFGKLKDGDLKLKLLIDGKIQSSEDGNYIPYSVWIERRIQQVKNNILIPLLKNICSYGKSNLTAPPYPVYRISKMNQEDIPRVSFFSMISTTATGSRVCHNMAKLKKLFMDVSKDKRSKKVNIIWGSILFEELLETSAKVIKSKGRNLDLTFDKATSAAIRKLSMKAEGLSSILKKVINLPTKKVVKKVKQAIKDKKAKKQAKNKVGGMITPRKQLKRSSTGVDDSIPSSKNMSLDIPRTRKKFKRELKRSSTLVGLDDLVKSDNGSLLSMESPPPTEIEIDGKAGVHKSPEEYMKIKIQYLFEDNELISIMEEKILEYLSPEYAFLDGFLSDFMGFSEPDEEVLMEVDTSDEIVEDDIRFNESVLLESLSEYGDQDPCLYSALPESLRNKEGLSDLCFLEIAELNGYDTTPKPDEPTDWFIYTEYMKGNMDYESQMTDSGFRESEDEVEFEDKIEEMELENPLGFGGGRKKSKKTKHKNTKKSKNRKKKTKRKSMNNKKNTKRKNTRSSNKKNTK
jgi:hypothetical protein